MYTDISWAERIKKIYSQLRPSEQKVADFLLDYQGTIGRLTLMEIARESMVSQPTVIRFVRALGFEGYRGFKYALLREERERNQEKKKKHAASKSSFMNSADPDSGLFFRHLGRFDLKPWDQPEDLPMREAAVITSLLEDMVKSLSVTDFCKAVSVLAKAPLIDIYFVEDSAVPAFDLLNKLSYLGIHCNLQADPYLQQISASHLGQGNTAIAFSHSGCSLDTVKALRLARKSGAFSIAVTCQKPSPLAEVADITLCYGGAESVIYGSAIFSRIPDLAIVDLLYMGIILHDYSRFSQRLDASGRVIADRGHAGTKL